MVQTLKYAPAQSNQTHNIQTGLNVSTLHSNPPSNYTTSRNLSRPPLQPLLTNSLSYNLTSTISSHTQHSSTNNTQLNSLNTSPPSQTSNTIRTTLQNTQFHIPNPPSTSIRTNLHFNNTFTNTFTDTSNVPTYITVPTSTLPQTTHSQPTYMNSSTSTSDPIKLFEGLDLNYTTEEY